MFGKWTAKKEIVLHV